MIPRLHSELKPATIKLNYWMANYNHITKDQCSVAEDVRENI